MSVSRVYQCLVGAVLLLAAAAPVGAATVTVAWDPNPEPDVVNYNVVVSTQPIPAGSVGIGAGVGNRTTWTFTGLQDSVTYYFAVQAQSLAGVSPFSQVTYLVPPTNPPGSERSRSDFNSSGGFDLLWENNQTGNLAFWQLNGAAVVNSGWVAPGAAVSGDWKLSGSADLNHDGKPDLIWHNQVTGDVVYWLMDGVNIFQAGYLPGPVNPDWRIASIRDLDGDGNPDIWWQNKKTGDMIVWYLNGTTLLRFGTPTPGRVADPNWQLMGTGNFTGSGRPDALWQNVASGELVVWGLNGINQISQTRLSASVGANWKVAAVGDVNGDGWPDIVWRNDVNGGLVLWEMVGLSVVRQEYLSTPAADINWTVMAPR